MAVQRSHLVSNPYPPSPRPAPARTRRMARLAPAVALAGLLAGCAASHTSGVSSDIAPQTVVSTLGSVTVLPAAGDPDSPALTVSGAALYPGPGGTEELRMSVTNQSDADEHLYGVSTAHASTVELLAAPASPGATPQPVGAVGIDLEPGATVTFGPGGAQILLDQPVGLTPGQPVNLALVFALAGLIHLTAPVRS